jgi:hypothetical protein
MLDVFVPQIVPQGSRVVPLVGESKSASVPQHVWVNAELEIGRGASPRDHLAETGSGERCSAFGNEHECSPASTLTM